MPTYEYHCPRCKANYDLHESFSAEPTHQCQQCARGTAKRVIHAPRVVFKGSGFYATDNKSRSTSVADSEPAVSKSESKTETRSVSKTESKSDSATSAGAAAAS